MLREEEMKKFGRTEYSSRSARSRSTRSSTSESLSRGYGGQVSHTPKHVPAAGLCTIKVTNVSKNTTEEELQKIFSFNGSVSLDSLKLNPSTIYNYAYVNYKCSSDADRAVAELNGSRNVDGVKFQVKLHTVATSTSQQVAPYNPHNPHNTGDAQNSALCPPLKVLLTDGSPSEAELFEFFSEFGELRDRPIIRKGSPDFTYINFKHKDSAIHASSYGKVEIKPGVSVRIRPTPGSTSEIKSKAQCTPLTRFDRKLIPCNTLISKILLSSNAIYIKHHESIAPVRMSLSKNSDGVILLGELAEIPKAESYISLLIKDIQRGISQKVLKVPCMYIPALCNPITVSSILEIEQKFSVEFLVCIKDVQHTQDITSFSELVCTKLASQSEVDCLKRFLYAEQDDLSVLLPESGIGHSVTQSSDFEWFWENDEGGYTKYDLVLNDKINRLYTSSSKGSLAHMILGTPTYNIDLTAMTQTNTSTGHKRRIRKATKDDTLQLTAKWMYRGDRKKMETYSTTESQEIEKMYKSKTHTVLTIGGKLYTFDFTRMKQINSSTQYERDIERQPVAPQVRHQLIFKLKVSGLDQNISSAESSLLEELKIGIVDQKCSLSQQAQIDSTFLADVSVALQKYLVDTKILGGSIHIRGIQGYSEKISLIVREKILDYEKENLTRRGSTARTTNFPDHWEPQTEKVVLKEVGIDSSERKKVEQMFHTSLPSAQVRSIQRIQNIWLWERYIFSKERISERNQGIVNEKELFHGTRGTGPEKIFKSEQGFDFRFSSTGMWGTGTYFAVNASYSDRYAYSSASGKQMILALVLTGETCHCQPNSSLKKPPIKPRTAARSSFEDELYDSVSGNTNGSDIFVVYDHEKAYPSYLITYIQ